MDEQTGTLQNSGILELCAVGFILDLFGPGVENVLKFKRWRGNSLKINLYFSITVDVQGQQF